MGKVTDKHGKRLVAYSVQDGEHGCIVFASNSATARRHGAGELGCDWEGVETCRRASWADSYAQDRRVPPLVMIANGWWFECGHCGCKVSDESTHDDDDETPHQPVVEGDMVFCSPACRNADSQEREEREARKAAAKKLAMEKFPECEVKWVGDFEPTQVMFDFPGCKYKATWTVGDELVSVSQCDLDAWKAYRAPYQAAEASA